MVLIGPGEYNLNGLKQINAKDSFLGLDEDTRGCGTGDSILSCRTDLYIESLLQKCGCLPITMRVSKTKKVKYPYINNQFQPLLPVY